MMRSPRHVLTCAECGAKRLSCHRPESPYAPKLCAACGRAHSRAALAAMMRRTHLPEVTARGHATAAAESASRRT